MGITTTVEHKVELHVVLVLLAGTPTPLLAYFDMLGLVSGRASGTCKNNSLHYPQMSGNVLIGGRGTVQPMLAWKNGCETWDVKHPRWNLATLGKTDNDDDDDDDGRY